MRKPDKLVRPACILGVVCLALLLCGGTAFAEEQANSWRGTYDMVMMWVNFLILAFIVVKFGKTPFMNFLKGQKDVIAREIQQLEEDKETVLARVKETFKQVEESDLRLEAMKEKIREAGKRRKDQIIQEANEQSAMMLEMSRRKIDGQIMHAREKFRAEMIEAAVNQAMERLPGYMTIEDNQRLTADYLSRLKE